uniref:Uncharacterized protein n=1 Tax=Anguilla anguilla TaxID=7936 RepID=A0A0E9WPP6_ANGAN
MDRRNAQIRHWKTLRCLVSSNPTSWSRQLVWAEYAHNTLCNASTGTSPFEAQCGYQPPLFPELEKNIEVPSAETFVKRCRSPGGEFVHHFYARQPVKRGLPIDTADRALLSGGSACLAFYS